MSLLDEGQARSRRFEKDAFMQLLHARRNIQNLFVQGCMNSWNLSVPLTQATEVSVIFFAGSYKELFAPFLSCCVTRWPPGRQRFITAKSHFVCMLEMAQIDLFGPGRSLSKLLHYKVASRITASTPGR